jgi:hypothetical protein
MQSAPKAPQMVLACRRRAHHLHVQGLARRASPQTPSGQPAFQLSQATRVRAMTFVPRTGIPGDPLTHQHLGCRFSPPFRIANETIASCVKSERVPLESIPTIPWRNHGSDAVSPGAQWQLEQER